MMHYSTALKLTALPFIAAHGLAVYGVLAWEHQVFVGMALTIVGIVLEPKHQEERP